jgi:D-alanyl-lipoteichoic acid acyltransferase DltB (MBOAT superfamily)
MIFNSETYILFLIAIVGSYWLLPQKGRTVLIFLASLTFYAFWRVEFLIILLISTATDYYVAIGIFHSSSTKRKRWLLGISLIVNLGLLIFFKYLYFLSSNINGLATLLGLSWQITVPDIILPLGISFYTFQTISYSIDVYRGTTEPERNFILYADYVLFFPQLVAGPILRAREVIHQFKIKLRFSMESLGIGLRRILMGLFLKVVLADNIAPMINDGFASRISALSALDVWVLTFLFGCQIYFDFSAYSHIAIGSARLLGITLPENFNFPYVAVSPQDFWGRWHISLSRWIKDYIFLPISYKISSGLKKKRYMNIKTEIIIYTAAIFFSMYLCGLWHGANWTFVIWGLYHALLMFLFRLPLAFTNRFSRKARKVSGWLFTLPLVMLGWVFFRARSVGDAMGMFKKVFIPGNYLHMGLRENVYLITALLMVGIIFAYYVKTSLLPRLKQYEVVFMAAESALYSIVIGFTFIFLRPIQQFIYFQF